MKIIVINGQGGSGKDTFVEYCQSIMKGYVFSVSMVDEVKKIAKLFGWTGGKELKDRKFLSDLKDLLADYNDFPFISVKKKINKKIDFVKTSTNVPLKDVICFVHARELNDIDRLIYDYGARALIIRRPEIEGTYGNHADDDVFEAAYDYEIWNVEDLNYLKCMAEIFITQIIEEEWESNLYGKDD